jgi:hypothetical protein
VSLLSTILRHQDRTSSKPKQNNYQRRVTFTLRIGTFRYSGGCSEANIRGRGISKGRTRTCTFFYQRSHRKGYCRSSTDLICEWVEPGHPTVVR